MQRVAKTTALFTVCGTIVSPQEDASTCLSFKNTRKAESSSDAGSELSNRFQIRIKHS